MLDPYTVAAYAGLKGICLTGLRANGASFEGCDLRHANLHGAHLQHSSFRDANLRYAYLQNAQLRDACLSGADLSGAVLRGADLSRTLLEWTQFGGADLSGTVLDPQALVPHPTIEEAEGGGFLSIRRKRGWRIVGWRPHTSRWFTNIYLPGSTHIAPIFSVCTESESHPGIYFGPREQMETLGVRLVRCSSWLNETIHVGELWRTRRLHILQPEPIRY